jgi:hypothetical protein
MRGIWTPLFALLVTLRVIASAGYMPMVEQGHLTVALCPDGEWTANAMPAMDHHGGKPKHHQKCPYAAAAATPFATGDAAPQFPLLPLSFPFVAASALSSFAFTAPFERPYSTGPPLRA